jgi:hypothetical protein
MRNPNYRPSTQQQPARSVQPRKLSDWQMIALVFVGGVIGGFFVGLLIKLAFAHDTAVTAAQEQTEPPVRLGGPQRHTGRHP